MITDKMLENCMFVLKPLYYAHVYCTPKMNPHQCNIWPPNSIINWNITFSYHTHKIVFVLKVFLLQRRIITPSMCDFKKYIHICHKLVLLNPKSCLCKNTCLGQSKDKWWKLKRSQQSRHSNTTDMDLSWSPPFTFRRCWAYELDSLHVRFIPLFI
jgi:hypothetical protein